MVHLRVLGANRVLVIKTCLPKKVTVYYWILLHFSKMLHIIMVLIAVLFFYCFLY